MEILFSFEGRIGRAQYWFHFLAAFFAFICIVGLPALVFEDSRSYDVGALLGVLAALSYAGMTWIMLALQVKRLHDRNRSGWWVLLGSLPLVNLWLAIEIAFLPGSPGRNEYGPPPA